MPSRRSSWNDWPSASPSPSLRLRRSRARRRALQLAHVERLDEIVVGARVEAVDAVRHRVPRGEHQHRHAVAGAAQPAADLEAVDVRKADVEHHRVRGAARDLGEGGLAAFGRHGVVATEHERAAQGIAQSAVVVDDQDLHGPHSGGSPRVLR